MIGERLKEERKRLEITQNDFANLTGVTRSAIVDWEKDKSSPSARQLVECQKAGFDITFILTGERQAIDSIRTIKKIDTDTNIKIPYFNIEASAGTGLYPIDEKYQESFAVSSDVFMRDLKYIPKNMTMIRVKGDSMIGVLNDGDRIIIDHDRTEVQEGIYVIRIDGELLVKRIQRMPGRIINVISSNPDYLPIPISLENPPDDFAIIGRVVMVCKFI